jgi:cell division control protein 6
MSRQVQDTMEGFFKSCKRQRINLTSTKTKQGLAATECLKEKQCSSLGATPEGTGAGRAPQRSPRRTQQAGAQAGASAPDAPPAGRAVEFQRVCRALETLLRDGTSESLFIAGLPGSGKTYVVERALAAFRTRLQGVHINLAGILRDDMLIETLANALAPPKTTGARLRANSAGQARRQATRSRGANPQAIDTLLQSRLQGNRRPLCLVLDEIDLWLTQRGRRSLAYSLLTIPTRFPEHCCIIGIANALDFTERVLPALRCATSIEPNVLIFTPYTAEDLIAIALERLLEQGCAQTASRDGIEASALELAARKVAAAHQGDVRTMLSACRSIVDKATETRPSAHSAVAALQAVVTQLYSKPNANSVLETIRSLPTQQQMILWVLAQNAHSTAITLRDLCAEARRLFTKLRLDPVDLSTLHEICNISLRHHGMVTYAAACKRGAQYGLSLPSAKVRLQIAPADVYDALRATPSLHALLGSAAVPSYESAHGHVECARTA